MWFCWWKLSHCVQKSSWVSKGLCKIKLEGVVTAVDQKTLIGFPVSSGEGRGQIGPALLILHWRNFSDQSSGVWQTERNELQENCWRNSCFGTTLTGSSVSWLGVGCQRGSHWKLMWALLDLCGGKELVLDLCSRCFVPCWGTAVQDLWFLQASFALWAERELSKWSLCQLMVENH